MSHFAQIENNVVVKILVAEQDFIDSGLVGDPKTWVQTSYNTYGGSHSDGKPPLRKNFAGVGYTYDESRDAFIPPKPFNSWVLDEETCLWNPPSPKPDNVESDMIVYVWNEELLNWEKVILEE